MLLQSLVARYPAGLPLIALAGSGDHAVVALRFSEVDPDEALRTPLVDGGRPVGPPFQRGLVGLLSYDRFAGQGDPPAARIFRVEQALVVNQATGEVQLTGDPTAPADYEVSAEVFGGLGAEPPREAPPLTLVPDAAPSAYLDHATRALADIRAGRYYQINLLRYFRAAEAPDRRWLAARLDRFGGPHACLFDLPDLTVASFSPERFVRLHGLAAETRPIKGTLPRSPDPEADAAAARDLQASRKDQAELHMIVDLMRNDLTRVALPGTVSVPVPGRLLSAPTVHHLEAVVTARLRPGLTLGAFLAAVCPGGSITGAPKREVMAAIRTAEARPRGYFMGHAFYLDDGGAFDSSILIRTLVKEGRNPYAFAAGSGIVTKSDPARELAEIDAKCRVVTET